MRHESPCPDCRRIAALGRSEPSCPTAIHIVKAFGEGRALLLDCFEPLVDPRTFSMDVTGFHVRFRHRPGILSPEGSRVNRWP
jgi:hypothetical protein